MPRIDINTKKQTTFNKDLKNLWDEYILIQEQLLKRRSAPISINPDSIHIEGHKIHAQVDESVRDRIVDKIFKEQLLLEPDDIHDDSILIKEMVWERLSCTDISSIQKELAACYIQMDDTPSISANVYYGNRIGLPSNLLTLSEIREHDKALRNGHICKGKIEDSVACITTLNVDFDLFYLYIFGEKHYSRLTKEKKGEETTKNVINYKNQYISEDSLREYGQKIGLRLEGYQLFFNITNDRAKEKMQELCEYYDPESKSFVFKRNLNKNESQINNVLTEIQSNITRFIQEARKYCSSNEISVETLFNYHVSVSKTKRYVFGLVSEYIYQFDNMSFNPESGNLGIDFNWRTDNIGQMVADLEKAVPFVTARTYGEDHKFKCKVTTSFIGFEEIKNRLCDRFENISVEDDANMHIVRITLSCQAIAYYDKLRDALTRELSSLNTQCKIDISERIPGKVQLRIGKNEEARIEDIQESLIDMRKIDFGFEVGEKTVPFGKLISVNYPNLIFDLDIDDANKEQIFADCINEKVVKSVVPILTGDIEKIARLKNTFSMAKSGEYNTPTF